MKLRGLIFLAAWLLIAAPGRAEEEVLHPRAPEPADNVVTRTPDRSGFPLLTVALVCAVTGGWLFWRQRRGVGLRGQKLDRKLVIAETRPLGNRQHLVVADYDGRKFLLGVCPGRIDLLAPLDGEKSPTEL